MAFMSCDSSTTIISPVPIRLPAFWMVSKSTTTSKCSAVKKSVEAPPGSQAFRVLPSFIPPARSSIIRARCNQMVTPTDRGHWPKPEQPNNLVPGVSLVPLILDSDWYQSTPWFKIAGILHKVSTLLTTVGRPHAPKSVETAVWYAD